MQKMLNILQKYVKYSAYKYSIKCRKILNTVLKNGAIKNKNKNNLNQ